MSVDEIVSEITANATDGVNTDYITLTEQMHKIENITEMLLGIFVVIIIIGLPIIIALELCYINFPIFQDSLENIMGKSKAFNNVMCVTLRDAKKTMRVYHSTDDGTTANLIYFKLKLKAIIIAVLIVGVVLGGGPSIVQWILKIAGPIINMF